MLICKNCGKEFSEHDAYRNASYPNGFLPVCKPCQRERAARSRAKKTTNTRFDTGAGAEHFVENYLKKRGIAVARHIGDVTYDLSAWGCATIEVKSASPHPIAGGHEQFLFGFTPDQLARPPSDIVALVTLDDLSVYFFAGLHPVFKWLHKNGSARKKAVAWTRPESRSYGTNSEETYLNSDLMNAHRDRWEIIEDFRLAHSRLLVETFRDTQ